MIFGSDVTRLLPAQARELARNLMRAASIADSWALYAAIARDGAALTAELHHRAKGAR